MPPRARHATLFPYTTLFRSAEDERDREVLEPPREEAEEAQARLVRPLRVVDADEQRPIGGEDRKSTRLNTSHMSISYAVFCLKKKKIYGELLWRHDFITPSS